MLIIANGAPKTGSTWVRHILANIIKYKDIPEAYCNKPWGLVGKKRSIAPYNVEKFLMGVDFEKENFLSKNHFYDSNTYHLLINNPNVRIFCIHRELKDVVVSYYYHQLRKDNIKEGFDKYYWRFGRYFIQFMNAYQNIWHQDNENVYVSDYQKLKDDFDNECRNIAGFLNIQLTDGQVKEIKEDTSLDSMRKKWGEEDKQEGEVQFFRKGIVGDWQNHFTDDILSDYEKIVQNGLSGIDYLKYLILYPLRLKLLHNYQAIYYSFKG